MKTIRLFVSGIGIVEMYAGCVVTDRVPLRFSGHRVSDRFVHPNVIDKTKTEVTTNLDYLIEEEPA